MSDLCHRCHRLLPRMTGGDSQHDDSALLFCPHCGAPQILLPEHMRTDAPGDPRTTDPRTTDASTSGAKTTGAVPPPRPAHSHPATAPGQVDWRGAMGSIALVAAVSAVLEILGLKFGALLLLCVLWTMSGAVIALGLYARSRPHAWVDARVGLRVGVVTGLLMVAAMGVALAGTGLILRFGSHGLSAFDTEIATSFDTMRRQMTARMQEQNQAADIQQKILGFMSSAEVRAGILVGYSGFLGGIVLALSAGGGAFAGMLRASHARRPGLRRGD